VPDQRLEATAREATGKGVARRLRAAGKIPAILYGGGRQAVPLALDASALQKLLHASELGMNTLIDLKVAGHAELDGKTVMVRELQRDPVRGRYVHADLYEVDLTQKIAVQVPIHVTGKAIGLDSGGIVDQALRELEVRCLPRAIPDQIVVDVTALDIGDSLHVRDLVLPEGVELVSDPDLSVISVVTPIKEEELVAAVAPSAEVPLVGAEPAEGAEGEEAAAKEGAEAKAEPKAKAETKGKGKESGD
jgi:large subunit ribosomal protein L25